MVSANTTSDFTRDALGRLSKVTNDVNGKMLSVTDFGQGTEASGVGITTDYEYDNKGNLAKETYKNGDYKVYRYDTRGNLSSTTTYKKVGSVDTEQLASEFTYDDFDRQLTRTDYSGSGSGKNVIYYQKSEYDGNGKLIKSYESQTRPADPNGISDDNKSLYYYDSIDRLSKVVYPAGTANETKAPRGLVYSYDGKGRLDKISAILKTNNVSSEEILREYEYDQWNEIAAIKDHHKFASGSSEYILKSYDYDKFGRTKDIKYSLSTAPNDVLESYSYDYDKNSNITKEKHTTGYQNAANIDETRNYEYDSLGRLTSSDVFKADGTQVNNSYGYDKVGNRRLESSGGTSIWTSYNGLDQMVDKKNAGGGVIGTYAYDQNGNQITEVSGGITKTSTYDAENRLTSVKKGSTVINSNTYRGDGQRIRKVEGSAVTNYTYLDGKVLYTSDSSGNRTSFNLYSADGGIISSKRYNGDNSGKYISYTKDARGSTSTVLNDNGAYLISYSYSDFGETTRNGSSDVFNEIAYTGGIYDASTELYYLNARYYDPADGVFLTQDTYRGDNRNPKSLHLYTYTENDPINFIDPSGYCKKRYGPGLLNTTSWKYKCKGLKKKNPKKISNKGLNFIKKAEGFYSKAYRGLDSNNQTIGYGHVIKSGEKFGTLTKSQASELLKKDLNKKSKYNKKLRNFLNKKAKIHVRQYEYDALLSLMYNVGPYMWKSSPNFTKLLKSGKFSSKEISSEFTTYIHYTSGGVKKKSKGLWRRHQNEALLFNTGVYKYYSMKTLKKKGYKM